MRICYYPRMRPKFLFLLFLVFVLFGASMAIAQQAGPLVAVTGGIIRGLLTEDGGAAFKGIPYARPPVGNLRWREPKTVEPWEGVRETTQFSIACTQLSEGWNERFVASSGEDCLYLNVATPEWPVKSKHPVMVWIHGGSNLSGDGDDAGFDERTLVHRGIVLVTISYRLGALGFLVHPELADESHHHASGNYGLMDQLAALRWIRVNIEKFGGNPENVTVAGESAGAFDISLLMTSPLAAGLFHRAVGESAAVASFHGPRTKEYATALTGKLAARVKAPEKGTIAFLRTLPAVMILKEMQLATRGDRFGLETSIDGWVLPESPAKVFAKGHSMPMPLLLGSNSLEIQGPSEPAEVREAIRSMYGKQAKRALELYGLEGEGVGKSDPIYGGPGIQWATDAMFRCAATEEVMDHSNAGHAAYQYEFQQPKPGERYTSHASELSFLFGTWGKDLQLSSIDVKVSEQMQAYWTNFARTGDPNGEGLPVWPKFTKEVQGYLAFTSSGAVAKTDLRREFCDVWRQAEKALENK